MDEKLLRLPEVIERVGLRRTAIYKRMDCGKFPKPVELGGPRRHVNAWAATEILAWIEKRKEERETLKAA